MTAPAGGGWLTPALSIAVVAVVLIVRLKLMRRARRMRLETLWILPAIFVALLGIVLVATPPTPLGWAAFLGLAVLGAIAGWHRGRTVRISIDPDTHRLSQRGSPAALLFVALLVLARNALRLGGAAVDATIATDALLGFGLGLIVVTRLEWFLRGRALLRAARAAPPEV